MSNQKGFRIWLARIVLTLFAVIILLPMVQTFLYSFSSIPEMQEPKKHGWTCTCHPIKSRWDSMSRCW